MDSSAPDEAAAIPKWRTLIRQHSAKISTFAEDVVLPKTERDSRQAATNEDLRMRNIEAQYPHQSTASLCSEKDDYRHFPIFMFMISLIQIIVYYSVDQAVMLFLFGYDPHRRHEIWRFVTMMLVHATWKRIGLIYVASVFGGALFISVLDNVYTVGASGGVYGMAFSHLATITLNWNEMERKICGLFTLSIYFGVDACFTLFNGFISKNKNSHISQAGHLGGAVTGFLVSILVLKNFKIEKWEKKMQKICVGLLIGICGIIFIVNVAASGYYVPIEWNFDYSHTYLTDYIHQVKNNSALMQKCEIDDACKQLLDQYNFNGTVSD